MQKRGTWSMVIGIVAAVLLMAPGLAPAAEIGPYIGIGGTFAKQDFDTGDLDRELAGTGLSADFDDTWGLNVKAGYKFNRYVAAELALDYLPNFKWSVATRVGGTPLSGELTVDVMAWTISAKISPFDSQKIKPYFVVGGGIMHASADATVSIPGASAYGDISYSSSDDETDLCGKIGLGVDFFVTDQVSLGLEGAYFAGFNDLDIIGFRPRFYTVTAGVAYHF